MKRKEKKKHEPSYSPYIQIYLIILMMIMIGLPYFFGIHVLLHFPRYSFQAKQDALEKNKNPEARYLEHSDQGKWDAHNNNIKG